MNSKGQGGPVTESMQKPTLTLKPKFNMKRTMLASFTGLAVAMIANSTSGLPVFTFDSETGNTTVNYGTGIPGGILGLPIQNDAPPGITWTIGFYAGYGSITVPEDPTGIADPSTLSGGALQNLNVTASLVSSEPGYFTGGSYNFAAYTSGPIMFMVTAYSGTSYDDSEYRGHSEAFEMIPVFTKANLISSQSGGMPSFDVYAVPEPSVFALSGISVVAILFVRRSRRLFA